MRLGLRASDLGLEVLNIVFRFKSKTNESIMIKL